MTETAASVPSRIQRYFDDYSSHHLAWGNKLCHSIGVPMITVSVLGLLCALPIAGEGLTGSQLLRLDGGTLLLGLAVLWYLFLDWKITIPFALFSMGLYFIGRATPMPGLWALFVLGWVIQFVGHYAYEKKSPAFFTNLKHLLVGPLWVFAHWIGYDVAS